MLYVLVLIDTWWNVNSQTVLINKYKRKVLIDTWWNVNLTSTGYVRRDFRVLIDTWWNVNEAKWIGENSSDTRFNRYMVECELIITDTIVAI